MIVDVVKGLRLTGGKVEELAELLGVGDTVSYDDVVKAFEKNEQYNPGNLLVILYSFDSPRNSGNAHVAVGPRSTVLRYEDGMLVGGSVDMGVRQQVIVEEALEGLSLALSVPYAPQLVVLFSVTGKPGE